MKFELITGAQSIAEAMEIFSQRFETDYKLHMYIIRNDLAGLAIDQSVCEKLECPFIEMPGNYWPKRNKKSKALRP
jgi:hypothetical protein